MLVPKNDWQAGPCQGREQEWVADLALGRYRASGQESNAEFTRAVSKEMLLDGVARGRTARANAQFVVERTHMGFDGEQAHDELLGNLGVAQSLRHQAQYLHLTCGRPIRVRSRRFPWRGSEV